MTQRRSGVVRRRPQGVGRRDDKEIIELLGVMEFIILMVVMVS